MPLGSTFANDLALALFQDNQTALDVFLALTNLYMSAHTADPGAAGIQTTSEISYTGYARQPLVRSAAGWGVSGAIINPVANVPFGAMTAGVGGIITHIMVGSLVSGAGVQLCRGALSPTLSAVVGQNPTVTLGSTITWIIT